MEMVRVLQGEEEKAPGSVICLFLFCVFIYYLMNQAMFVTASCYGRNSEGVVHTECEKLEIYKWKLMLISVMDTTATSIHLQLKLPQVISNLLNSKAFGKDD
uniref:Uncharacterized protein n=1 Tax=Glossina austeni TaxID=7395 RepID=A0A1A9V5C9_GLOAU